MTKHLYCAGLCLGLIGLAACVPSGGDPATEASAATVPASAATNTTADENRLKLATVRQLYPGGPLSASSSSETAVMETESRILPASLLSADFQAVLQREARASAALQGIACIDYDPVIQGQDWDADEIAASLQLQVLDNGMVAARFRNFEQAHTLHYVLQCQNGRCLIDDLIEVDAGSGSYKQGLNACLDQLAAQQPFE